MKQFFDRLAFLGWLGVFIGILVIVFDITTTDHVEAQVLLNEEWELDTVSKNVKHGWYVPVDTSGDNEADLYVLDTEEYLYDRKRQGEEYDLLEPCLLILQDSQSKTGWASSFCACSR
jgi:hypothetical protein